MNAQSHLGEKLSAYLDDELPPLERAAVEQHLRECASCGQLLEDLAAVDTVSRSLAVQAPEGYFDAFPARVRSRLPAQRSRRVPAWTWAAAAALLLAVITPLTQRSRPSAPATAARDEVRQEAPSVRENAPAPIAAGSTAPPTTVPMDLREQVADKGYANVPPAQPEAKEGEFRQRAATLDGRLREREAETDAGTLARAEPSRRSGALKDDALKLKKEAGADLAAPAGDKPPMRTTDGDKLAANAAGPPASVVVPAPAAAAEEEAQPKAAKRADAPTPGTAGGRAALPAATPPPQPAAPPPAEAPRVQGYAGQPSPAEGALGATKAASARERTAIADADAYGEEFAAIASRPLATAEEARQASREWSELGRRTPQAPGADEARVRAIEALATAWRLERKDEDRAQARRLAQAYLATSGPQKDRVRAAVRSLER